MCRAKGISNLLSLEDKTWVMTHSLSISSGFCISRNAPGGSLLEGFGLSGLIVLLSNTHLLVPSHFFNFSYGTHLSFFRHPL